MGDFGAPLSRQEGMNFTRVLSFVPYPYRFSLHSNIYASQIIDNWNQDVSWQWLSFGPKFRKSFLSMYYTTGISRLFLRHFIWSKLSNITISLGLVSESTPASSVAQTILTDQLRLIQIRYEIENITEKREKAVKLFANAAGNDSDDENESAEPSPEEIQLLLDKLGADLTKLNEEKSFIKQRIRQKRKEIPKQNSPEENVKEMNEKSHLISDRTAEWVLGVVSILISETILYPLTVVESWMYALQQDCSCFSAASNLFDAIRLGNKNLYDGFTLHCISSVGQGLLMYPLMRGFKRLLNIPEEPQLQKSMRILLSLFTREDPFEEGEDGEYEWSPAERKREIVTAFRAVMMNTFAYNLSNWISHCALYPLFTCKTAMITQGCDYLFPSRFPSTISVIQYINLKKGIPGFYRGFQYQLLTIIPEMIMLLGIYVAGAIWIEYSLSDDDFEDEDEDKILEEDEIGDDEFINS